MMSSLSSLSTQAIKYKDAYLERIIKIVINFGGGLRDELGLLHLPLVNDLFVFPLDEIAHLRRAGKHTGCQLTNGSGFLLSWHNNCTNVSAHGRMGT